MGLFDRDSILRKITWEKAGSWEYAEYSVAPPAPGSGGDAGASLRRRCKAWGS